MGNFCMPPMGGPLCGYCLEPAHSYSIPVCPPVLNHMIEGVHVERFFVVNIGAASTGHGEKIGTWHPIILVHNQRSQKASTLGILFCGYLIEQKAKPVIIVRDG